MNRNDVNYSKVITLKIEKTQNVEIIGAQTNTTANQLGDLVGMRTIHGHPMQLGTSNLPNNRPTFLRLRNCNFFTYELTTDKFIFDDTNGVVNASKRYCEILGGDMFYTKDFTISLGNEIPLLFPIMNAFVYTIRFSNSCDSTPDCRFEEDFKYLYDIVKESVNPHRRFKMLKDPTPKAIGTGACLPVCEDC